MATRSKRNRRAQTTKAGSPPPTTTPETETPEEPEVTETPETPNTETSEVPAESPKGTPAEVEVGWTNPPEGLTEASKYFMIGLLLGVPNKAIWAVVRRRFPEYKGAGANTIGVYRRKLQDKRFLTKDSPPQTTDKGREELARLLPAKVEEASKAA